MDVPYSDFIEQVEYIEKQQEKEQRKKYITAAYSVWLQGIGGKKTFGEYLDSLGLSEKPVKMTKKQMRKIAIAGLRTAQNILKSKYIRKKK